MKSNRIYVIVFDLDDTLLDTTKELLPIANTPTFREKISRPLSLMKGAEDNLKALAHKYNLFLLTQGDPEIQNLKIRNLPLQSYFSSIYVANKSQGESKKKYFEIILKNYLASNPEGTPQHILSIGNRILTDLVPAFDLGYKTCHFEYGEHVDEGRDQSSKINFKVKNHKELLSTCFL